MDSRKGFIKFTVRAVGALTLPAPPPPVTPLLRYLSSPQRRRHAPEGLWERLLSLGSAMLFGKWARTRCIHHRPCVFSAFAPPGIRDFCFNMEEFAYRKLPITFLHAHLDSNVLELLQVMPILSLSEEEMGSGIDSLSHGFVRASDNPRNHGHIYFEGYAHAHFPTGASTPCNSMNPRTGRDYDKPAAPAPLLAFFEATRWANAELLADAAKRLDRVSGQAAALLANLVRGGRAWADLALQTHYGTDEPGIWHCDSANSLLHLAVSVRGTRALLSIDDDSHTRSAPRRSVLPPGSAYLTSPALFPHAVEYTNAPDHNERILAVQARFLTSLDEIHVLEAARRGVTEEWEAIAEAFSAALAAAGGLKLPSMVEVQAALAGLAAPPAGST
jgi:hypothetical protein